MVGPLDEYRRREIGKASSATFIWLYYILLFSSLMASILGIYFPKVIAIAFPIFILLLALLTQEIVYLKTEDRGVQKFDKEELSTLPITPKQLKRRAILTAILLPLAIFLWIVFQKSLDWKVNYLHALWRSLTSPLVILLIVGFLIIEPLVGGMIYFPQIEL
ncbi:DUF3278 domain-containing protein [Streptococcus anginosus]|uniref:DUF3278 domain-containing protein n=1 Tax=Streptococcus anginosus TaxID=1328 RepID=UPI000D03B1B7|nr:DUF3278 domain-containing protein [Streptococcus anginosus]HBJ54571.1 DUF3278 domain-containing protein [Streptococcus sp.]MDB8657025.1 DUF3278 domain-containing protein [Streptococcus anginosus]MDX5015548.1 DUF3278 domain-containing protein [Streptococcus anginosus]MDX5019653.1 DUF3278 domain-containing protein [Streptococcus anginosus]PRT77374.1 hypothetical protein C6A25_01740 [Streptococcus anginosus]